jgi:glycosyltransferase involved in cell wall biosynthesis
LQAVKEVSIEDPASARPRIGVNAHLLAGQESYRRAGVSRYIEGLLSHLMREDSEIDCTVFWGPHSALEPMSRQDAIRSCRIRRSQLPTHSPWVRILWEQCLQPPQLHNLGIRLLHSPVNIQPLVLPCKGVVTMMDLSFLVFPESFRGPQRRYQRLFTQLSARRATHLIAISRSTAQDLTRFFGVNSAKVSVTLPGVDARYTPLEEAVVSEWRRKGGLPERFLLYVGTLEPRKNLPTLIRAFAAFRRGNTAVKLVLAGGKGWMYQPILASVEELGLQDDVLFPGYIAEDELPLWYNAAEVFVYPSLYEGFGLPPLEAMACGTPVIASNASSLPEVVGSAGLLVSPDDVEQWCAALSQLTGDSSLRASLSQRGLERAKEFTWARMAEQTARVYRHVLAGGM